MKTALLKISILKKTTLFACILPCLVFAQTKSYNIKGNVKGAEDSSKIYLTDEQNVTLIIDSSIIKNEKFSFTGTLTGPRAVTVFTRDKNKKMRGFVPFYIEPGLIKINSNDTFRNSVVNGGNVNEDYKKFQEGLRVITSEENKELFPFRSVPKEQLENKETKDSLDAIVKKYNTLTKAYYLQFIKGNPKSFISLKALKGISGYSPEYAEYFPLFSSLSPEIQNTKEGKDYAQILKGANLTMIGKEAPDFSLQDTSGKQIKLSDLRGNYVLIDFWASWCAPCRAQMPQLLDIYKRYNNKGFEILGVSLDSQNGKNNWLAAIKKDGMIWKNVSDLKGWKNMAAQTYGIQAIPQNFLLDKAGKIIAKNIKDEELDQKLKDL